MAGEWRHIPLSDRVGQEGLSDEIIFEWTPEGIKGLSRLSLWRKGPPQKGHSGCEGPKGRSVLVISRNCEETSAARVGWMMEEMRLKSWSGWNQGQGKASAPYFKYHVRPLESSEQGCDILWLAFLTEWGEYKQSGRKEVAAVILARRGSLPITGTLQWEWNSAGLFYVLNILPLLAPLSLLTRL